MFLILVGCEKIKFNYQKWLTHGCPRLGGLDPSRPRLGGLDPSRPRPKWLDLATLNLEVWISSCHGGGQKKIILIFYKICYRRRRPHKQLCYLKKCFFLKRKGVLPLY